MLGYAVFSPITYSLLQLKKTIVSDALCIKCQLFSMQSSVWLQQETDVDVLFHGDAFRVSVAFSLSSTYVCSRSLLKSFPSSIWKILALRGKESQDKTFFQIAFEFSWTWDDVAQRFWIALNANRRTSCFYIVIFFTEELKKIDTLHFVLCLFAFCYTWNNLKFCLGREARCVLMSCEQSFSPWWKWILYCSSERLCWEPVSSNAMSSWLALLHSSMWLIRRACAAPRSLRCLDSLVSVAS